jgi:hypothetical protein
VVNKYVKADGVPAKTYVLIPKLQNVSADPIEPPVVKYNAEGTIALNASKLIID